MLIQLYRRIRYHLFAPLPGERLSEKPVKDWVRKVRYNLFGHLPLLGRKRSRGETHKARARRAREGFFERYCRGHGLDVGYGGDPVVPGVVGLAGMGGYSFGTSTLDHRNISPMQATMTIIDLRSMKF